MFDSPIFATEDLKPRPAPDDDFWYSQPNQTSLAGLVVTADTALRVSAVMACVRVLAQTLAQLPLNIYERVDDTKRRIAREHPLYALLHLEPNAQQTSFEWRETKQAVVALRGNTVSEIVPGRRGFAAELRPLDPDYLQIVRLPTGRLRYDVTDPVTGATRKLTQDEVLHVRGLSTRNGIGLSVLQAARDTIGVALAADVFNASMLGNKARPGTVLEADGNLNEEQVKVIRSQWERFHRGAFNAGRTAVLSGGVKAKELGLTAEDLQFIEGRKFSVEEICRLFGVPPHMAGQLDRATFSNIEHQAISFVVHTMLPWCVRWEQRLNKDLILEPDRYYFEFDVKGLLRGDSKSRGDFYQKGIQSGWLTRNEVRRLENLEPLEGLDAPLEPLNMDRPGNRSGARDRDADDKE